ncbi:enoyl-CoA hydratase/isomerase (macronuclear) [Tetrahymena thermophila SB210]|uniref:3-hydroxyisobutyryl-CoA hydrolase n=1 Tax=Tetrahymena thermophila (strain SB210) TaxID=312017 RepID=Q230X4_TETTS|nr:enoyl-CoA hydratase/isomerase [Tetrahymena thermophila SB210]EAR91165.2 enoyl-CoA hydratase/isomerase [Tetrahymena thermophila SB210]|eukprot:XP_001011410.2 enoyl-CoA hydratase/isomerase [Tetrahymena thermophila SB210]
MRRITQLNRQIVSNFSSSTDSVLFTQDKFKAKVVLNKPKALNALDLAMIRQIQGRIVPWTQEGIKAVWINGAGGKAFCAGGDIKSLYDAKKSGKPEELPILDTFFREEFTLDYELANMKPTQIAVMDGIVMGGGVGISVHAPIKIATENSVFAMPEAKIAFFTDVGGGYFLSRLRSNIGLYLGLTGARLKGKELVATGVANYYVPRNKLDALEEEVKSSLNQNSTPNDIKNIVAKYAEQVPLTFSNEEEIKQLFNGETFQSIYQNIQSSTSEFGQSVAKLINQQNAISLRIIFEQIKRGKKLNLKENFVSDFRLTQRFTEDNDFFEGIRTVLIDRSDTPNWTYKSPLDVPQTLIDQYFAPLPYEKELKI